MAEYGRIQKKQESRAVANNDTGSRQLKEFVDNTANLLKHTKILCPIQRIGYHLLQRQIHLVNGVNARGIAPHDNSSHAYYCIANNGGGTILSSVGYGSCIGMAVYRPPQQGNPSRGMIVHFWAGGVDQADRMNKFGNDVLDVLDAWGGIIAGDVITIWQGANPEHLLSQERWNVFPDLIPPHVAQAPHATGNAFLNLDTGAVTP